VLPLRTLNVEGTEWINLNNSKHIHPRLFRMFVLQNFGYLTVIDFKISLNFVIPNGSKLLQYNFSLWQVAYKIHAEVTCTATGRSSVLTRRSA
jgi:hypothetical protein